MLKFMESLFQKIYSSIKVVYLHSPLAFRRKIAELRLIYRVLRVRSRIPSTIERLRTKDVINVFFLAMNVSMWKYDGVFRLMKKHSRFRPIVVLAPRINQTEEDKQEDIDEMKTFFVSKGCEYIEVDDELKFNPDIVFYTQPYDKIISEKFCVDNLKNTLICYVPYGFWVEKYSWGYNQCIHNCAWKQFLPTLLHKELASKLSLIRGKNTVVTGYPMADEFFSPNRPLTDPWKIKNHLIKRIIWAPHHSIDQIDALDCSTFLENHQIMIDLARNYHGFVQIAFKPHPMLATKLMARPDWGPSKTQSYFQEWLDLPNGQIESGEYIDLFLTSDAMIHDCSSFMVEYLYVQKPVMYLAKANNFDHFCDFGKLAYNVHYKGLSQKEIKNFIENVVLEGKDWLSHERKLFFDSFLSSSFNDGVANTIFQKIVNELFFQGSQF